MKGHDVESAEQLLDRITQAAAEGERVSVETVLECVGRRSFGPLLLVAGLVMLAPVIGDIPGVPVLTGLLVLLTGVQLLLGRDHFWLPHWLLARSVSRDRLCRTLEWLRRPARFLDKLLRHRLAPLVHGAGLYVVAIVSVAIAATTPLLEFVPFSANGAGAALTAFGLALVGRDGLLALIAFVITAATVAFVLYGLL